MGCATGIVRYLVFLFNLVFALSGLTMFIFGIVYVIDIKDISNALEDHNVYVTAPTLVIVVGAVIFFISFFGCCGAIRKNTCMLTTYGVILLVLFALQIGLGIFAFLQVKESGTEFRDEINRALRKGYDKYSEPAVRDAIDVMQQIVKCCGYLGPGDFHQSIPNSCCQENKKNCRISDSEFFRKPCKDKVYSTLKDSVEVLGWIALGLCVTELIAAIFSFCLSHSFRRNRGRVYN